MGRKPNPLILEFFERGAKLDDQSNRYQHTCKRCGMFFPKGRPDSMNRHLFEKCPNVSDFDRTSALAFAQGQLNTEQIARRFGLEADMFGSTHVTNNPGAPYAPNHTVALQPGQSLGLNRETSALDTLAEVSRQHLDLSRHRLQADGIQLLPHDGSVETQQEMDSWMVQLSQHLAESNQAGDSSGVSAGHVGGGNDVQQADVAPLVHAANAANQLQASIHEQGIAHTQGNRNLPPRKHNKRKRKAEADHGNIDPALRLSLEPSENTRETSPQVIVQARTPDQQPGHSTTGTAPSQSVLHMDEQRTYGLLSRPLKRQRRNKFTDEGRKKVGGVRKLGACLRCKMLKKPCSGETPCATCSAIGAPRLWRAACIRTRVAEEFTLFNTSYFFARARAAALSLTGDSPSIILDGYVELVMFPEIAERLHFPVRAHTRVLDSPPGGKSPTQSVDQVMDTSHLILQIENKDVGKWLSASLDRFIDAESTKALLITLRRLRVLTNEEAHDPLAHNTLLLWAATMMLVAGDTLEWTFQYRPAVSDTTSSYPLTEDRPDFPVLKAHILDSVERFASSTIKQIANELERRLLARTSSTPLTTYLTTFVLLNAVERVSLFFRRLDPRDVTSTASGAEDEDGVPDHWPLTRTPAAYFRQGDSFASLLVMLLRMRNLPPRTMVGDDDSLIVLKLTGRTRLVEVVPKHMTSSHEDNAEHANTNEQLDVADYLTAIATWLSETGWTGRQLWMCNIKADDDIAGDWRAWDLRFASLLLLPQDYGAAVAGHEQDAAMAAQMLSGTAAAGPLNGVEPAAGDDYYEAPTIMNGDGVQAVDPAMMLSKQRFAHSRPEHLSRRDIHAKEQ